MDVVTLGDFTLGRGTFEPGWQWSKDIKPIAGTESCMVRHTGICVSGKMTIRTNDGAEATISAGDVFVIEPEHEPGQSGMNPASCTTPALQRSRNRLPDRIQGTWTPYSAE